MMKTSSYIIILLSVLIMFPYASASLSDDIIAYYKLDETSGTIFVDSVNGYNATGNTSIVNGLGIINTGANLTSGDRRIELPNNNALNFSTGYYTISVWYYSSNASVTGKDDRIISKTFVSGSTYKNIMLDVRSGKIYSYIDGRPSPAGAYIETTGSTTLQNNTWYNIVMTIDRYDSNTKTNLTTYLNGNREATESFNGIISMLNSNPWYIGYANNVLDYMHGFVDEVGLWNRVLNSTEITELYNDGVGIQYDFLPLVLTNITSVDINTNTTSVLVDEVFNWSVTYTPDNATNVSLVVDFDDSVTSTASSGTYSYSIVGLYNISVVATDGQNNSMTDFVIINVSALPEPEPMLKNITFGLYDNTNNVSLSGFFYDYNGTTYFSSGTTQTRLLDYGILYNVSFTKTGYDNVDYLNVNISEESQTTITGFTNPIPAEVVNMSNISFTAITDANLSISGFSVSVNNGVYFGTATGTELVLVIPENDTINQLFNLSYSKFGYYTSTYENINLSTLAHEGVLVAKTYTGDESLDDKAVIWIIFALVAGIGISAIFSKPMLIVFGFAVMFLTYFLGGNIMVSYYWFNPLGYILGAVIILTGMLRLGFGD